MQDDCIRTVKRTARKEKVGEGLVRRCVAEEIGRRLGAREVTETPEFIGLDEFSVSPVGVNQRGERVTFIPHCHL